MYTFMYTFMYTCMYIILHICVHVYTHIHVITVSKTCMREAMYCMWETQLKATGGVYIIVVTYTCYMLLVLLPHLYTILQYQAWGKAEKLLSMCEGLILWYTSRSYATSIPKMYINVTWPYFIASTNNLMVGVCVVYV